MSLARSDPRGYDAEHLKKVPSVSQQVHVIRRDSINLDESSRKLDEMRTESGAWARQTREEMTNSLKGSNDSVLRTLTGISETQ